MAALGPRAAVLWAAPLLLVARVFLGHLPVRLPQAWIRPLARAGAARPGRGRLVAQVAVADEVQTATGVAQEDQEAGTDEQAQSVAQQLEELERRAAEGDADALFRLGRAFRRRKGPVAQNLTRAFELLQAAADMGHAEAQSLAGLMLYKGEAPCEDGFEALSYLTQAAEAGLAKAQYNAAMLHYEGVGLEEPDLLGFAFWLKQAASGGHVLAQYRLGDLLLSGEVLKQNETWAAEYFEMAAEQGHVRAQEAIGLMYRTGTGVELDAKAAASWLEKAAEQGDAMSAYTLGCMIRSGENGQADPKLALYWLTKAADQGHVQAAEDLGVMFLTGEGTEPDEEGSAYWFMHAEKWKQQLQANGEEVYDDGDDDDEGIYYYE